MAELEADTDTIFEEREEFMVSPSGGGIPTLRPAHFLKPSVSSIDDPIFENLPSSALCSNHNLVNLPLKVSFKGWRGPMMRWKSWVDRMNSLHQSTWRKAGVYEAIITSTYQIPVNKEIVLGLASRWCPETNSFVFPFGEATITLEDVLILGGYSVVGNSVFSPLETKELIEIDKKLVGSRGGKANNNVQQVWAKYFMESGSEIEHEAFLVAWLSRHVFPKSFDCVRKDVHSIAVHIARGTRVALSPAVLACLYRDLRMLKEAIVATSSSGRTMENGVILLDLYSPFQLVQIWAYERFPTICPKHISIQLGEPRMARWNKVKRVKIENAGSVIDCAGESFLWRPYVISAKSSLVHKFYKEREEWLLVRHGMNEELESFSRFLRASELVGLDCIEQYLPHRVAMQFGMDQDLPSRVPRANDTMKIAWKTYKRPIRDAKLYIPSRLFESDVTTRYLKWWKQLKFVQKDAAKGGIDEGRRISKCSTKSSESSKGKEVENLAESVGNDKQALVESVGDKVICDDESFPWTEPQISSSLAAGNGAAEERESEMKQGENTRCIEAAIGKLNQSIETELFESRERNEVDHGVTIISFPWTEPQISSSLEEENARCVEATMGELNQSGETELIESREGSEVDNWVSTMDNGDNGAADNEGNQTPSSLAADNGGGTDWEFEMKPGKNARYDEAAIGEMQLSVENATVDSREGNETDNGVSTKDNEGEISIDHITDGAGLEARISKLELVVARLKAKKLGLTVPLNPNKRSRNQNALHTKKS